MSSILEAVTQQIQEQFRKQGIHFEYNFTKLGPNDCVIWQVRTKLYTARTFYISYSNGFLFCTFGDEATRQVNYEIADPEFPENMVQFILKIRRLTLFENLFAIAATVAILMPAILLVLDALSKFLS